jgi:3-oxoacyl-[acyl-carrier protein] reductase
MGLLEGKTAVVTGASRGIGKAVAALFLEQGATVLGTATKAGDFCAELEAIAAKAGTKVSFLYADIGKASEAADLAERILAACGKVDVLVNNAGITKDGLFMRMSDEDWNAVLAVNLSSGFILSRRIVRDMISKRSGSVIFMSSIIGVHGGAGQANYAASKAGMIGMAKSIAQEVGSRGIRVNSIAPGYVATDMTDALPEKAKEAFLARIPLGRPATPRDVANAALFLASDLSAYITGTVLDVDGGLGV